MTTTELSVFFGKSKQTIINHAKDIGLDFKHGVKKNWNKEEVELLAKNIYKNMPKIIKDSIDLTFKNLTVESVKNLTVNDNKLESMFIEFMKQQTETNKILLSFIMQNKQIELKQDFFSILGYMKYKGIEEAKFSEMIIYGKEASKISKEMGKDIRKIPDERYGRVNSYHIAVLEKLFEL